MRSRICRAARVREFRADVNATRSTRVGSTRSSYVFGRAVASHCGPLEPEPVKRFETSSVHEFCAASSLTGGLIHATSGSTGACGGRFLNRMGLAA
jgi:hypothetical protein